MPTVSVIIPTYNRANTLPDAIESVLNQTFADYELIVVDDGSNDDTHRVVDGLLKGRGVQFRYLYKVNGGEASARNHGLMKATGDYVAFLDSDDFWLPDHLKVAAAALNSDDSLAGVFTDHGIMRDRKDIVATAAKAGSTPKELVRKLALREFVIASDAMVVRRSIYAELGFFNEQLHVGTDWEMWMRIASHHVIGYVPVLTVVVIQHDENTSANPDKIEKYGTQAIDLVMGYADPEIVRLKKLIMAKHLMDVAYFYSKQDKRLMAIRKLAAALGLNGKLYRNPVFIALLARICLGRRGFEYLRTFKHGTIRRGFLRQSE